MDVESVSRYAYALYAVAKIGGDGVGDGAPALNCQIAFPAANPEAHAH
jgi:hypothetical protein